MSPEMITILQMAVVVFIAIVLIRVLFSVGKKLISGLLSVAVTIYVVIQYGIPLLNHFMGS